MKQFAYTTSVRLAAMASALAIAPAHAQQFQTYRPFGTLREQAARQQKWLDERMTTVLPALMRKHKVDMWVVPMREYNEDPVFSSIVSPTTFAARRRTIYLFFDPCGPGGSSSCVKPVEKLAMGGTSQGGVFQAIRSTKAAAGPAGGQVQAQAELWGDEQWQVLKAEIEKRNPKAIAIDISTVFAFNDGLSAGELEGMRAALGQKWTSRFHHADDLALDLIATRVPDEVDAYHKMQEVVWGVIPQVGPLWTSYALYRFESNSRSATVLGLIGAGGIGQTLFETLNSFSYSQVSAIVLVIVVAVSLIDFLSQAIRSRLL